MNEHLGTRCGFALRNQQLPAAFEAGKCCIQVACDINSESLGHHVCVQAYMPLCASHRIPHQASGKDTTDKQCTGMRVCLTWRPNEQTMLGLGRNCSLTQAHQNQLTWESLFTERCPCLHLPSSAHDPRLHAL
jgi:hypothetical protein